MFTRKQLRDIEKLAGEDVKCGNSTDDDIDILECKYPDGLNLWIDADNIPVDFAVSAIKAMRHHIAERREPIL